MQNICLFSSVRDAALCIRSVFGGVGNALHPVSIMSWRLGMPSSFIMPPPGAPLQRLKDSPRFLFKQIERLALLRRCRPRFRALDSKCCGHEILTRSAPRYSCDTGTHVVREVQLRDLAPGESYEEYLVQVYVSE